MQKIQLLIQGSRPTILFHQGDIWHLSELGIQKCYTESLQIKSAGAILKSDLMLLRKLLLFGEEQLIAMEHCRTI